MHRNRTKANAVATLAAIVVAVAAAESTPPTTAGAAARAGVTDALAAASTESAFGATGSDIAEAAVPGSAGVGLSRSAGEADTRTDGVAAAGEGAAPSASAADAAVAAEVGTAASRIAGVASAPTAGVAAARTAGVAAARTAGVAAARTAGVAFARTAGGASARTVAEPTSGGPALQTVELAVQRRTQPFSLLGITWSDPRAKVDGIVRVRTRTIATRQWTTWQNLEADSGIAGLRGATDPLWVGPSDAVEAHVVAARAPLPTGLRVDLINPDATKPPTGPEPPTASPSAVLTASTQLQSTQRVQSTASSASQLRSTSVQSSQAMQSAPGAAATAAVTTASASRGPATSTAAMSTAAMSTAATFTAATSAARPAAAPAGRTEAARATVALPARPVPRMVTRAGWGANQAIVKGTPEYSNSVQAFFVHHTATGNGYSCTQSASIVRGIQAYQVRSRGWDDIGYNFLIDKCGRIFEGRVGGVGRAVVGAHTLGFNADASAIAVIGTYGGVGISPTVRTAVATVAAYKLGAYGNAPNGRVFLTSGGSDRFARGRRVLFNRIAGHRDAGRTDCPGDVLYSQLPSIRAIAGAAPANLRLLRMSGATRYGALLFTKGLVRPLWNVDTPSALINRFEVWVDGRLTVATPGSHRTTALRLAPGGHSVTVRALHLSGRTTTVTSKIVSDPNAPIFTSGPEVVLRPGSLNGSVPIRLDWTATDVNGLATVGLVRPTSVNLGTAARSRNGTIQPGVPTTFAVRAVDRAGNAVNASVTRTPVVLSEAVAQRTGTWRTLSNPGYLGGAALGSSTGRSSVTWTFTGRSVALAAGRSGQSGRVRIFIDGRDQGVVDLRSAKTLYRQAVWARWWSQSAQHTVRIEAEGTTGRPGVVLDGLVYLK